MSDHSDQQRDPEATDTLEGYEEPGPGGWEGYPLDELAIRDERRTAVDVVRRLEQGRFVLDPDFQRDFVWDKDKLDSFIAKPDEVVPGNNMKPYGGLTSAEDRAKVIAFLESPTIN